MYLNIENRKIYLNVWDKVENPKGIIQVIHGMAEYGARYKEFAEFFNQNGYIVIADDHYGHGNSINKFYGELTNKGFKTFVDDELFIAKFLNETYKLPIFVLGHSMGSFITQYLMLHDLPFVSGYAIIGSSYTHKLKTKLGAILIKILNKTNPKAVDTMVDKLMFGNFNIHFEKRTKFDWISKNTENVDEYIADPNCGLIYPTSFYKEFVKALYELHIDSKFKKLKNKKNLLIISGEMDPVGEYSKGVRELTEFYIANGFNCKFKSYQGLRHELLNEKERTDVFEEILNFIK